MKTYRVELEFKRAPAIGMTVDADDKDTAINAVKKFARESGWVEPIRKASAREVQA